jgi:hypothetical protein
MELALKIAKNWFQQLEPKYMAYQYKWGIRCKELIARSPFTFIADNFSSISAGNRFCRFCDL